MPTVISMATGRGDVRSRWAAAIGALRFRPSPPEDAFEAEQKRLLTDSVLLVGLRPLFTGVAAVIFAATSYSVFNVAPQMVVPTLAIGLLIGGFLLLVRYFMLQDRVPTAWAHPLAALLSSSGFLFVLYNLVVRNNTVPELRFIGLALLVIITGALFLHLRWLLCMMLFIFTSWTSVNLAFDLHIPWSAYLILYPIIAVSSLASFYARKQAISRVIDAQMEVQRGNAQLAEALERAYRSEAQLKAERDHADQVVDSMGQGLVLLDGYGLIEYANPAAERILGSSTTALIGRAADDLFRGQDGRPSAQMRGDPRHIAPSQDPYEAFIEQTNGSVASVLVATAAREGGGAILTLTDLTLRKQFEAKLQRLAHYDALTNLANRPHFTERFEELAADLRNSAVRVAVLFIDLDGFKQINDTLGHAIGDQVLIETGKRIVNCVRARDLAARFGGDEFVVLLVDIEDEKSVIEIANRIVSRIAEPYLLPNRIETLSGSVGISISQPPNFDPETLISQADIAMYEAKRGLRANAVVYRPEMQIHIHRLA